MTRIFTKLLLAATFAVGASAARADIAVRFDEGAPKDRFSFENLAECAIEDAILVLDLKGSAGGLIFDVTGEGAGVEVFQPLEMIAGREALAGAPKVKDGDDSVTFRIGRWPGGSTIAFTIDVDDTKKAREITVTDSEIAGAVVSLVKRDGRAKATFSNSRVKLEAPACP